MDDKRLLELAGVQLNEGSAKNSIDFHQEKFNYMIKTLLVLEKKLIAQNHIASSKSISNIIGGMQKDKGLFASAKKDLGK